jgi:hypothetical protein
MWASRGESKYIIFARAFILSCIALGVPAFGRFAVVIRPVKSAVSTRNIVKPTWPEDYSGPGNVSASFVGNLFFYKDEH